jgi:hypothetical protein
MEITFNKSPYSINFYDPSTILNGLSESTGTTNLTWGSYNGGTNIVIYPQGRSIMDLEAMILFQITSSSLTNGAVGVNYTNQLQVAGGSAPFTWTLASSSAALPPGLSLSPAGVLSGIPTTSGTFLFPVSVMDAGPRTTTRELIITIEP